LKNEISKVGFGAWGLGGDAYGKVSRDQAFNALKAAMDNGINFVDTSDLYGNGRSEEIIGEFINSLSNKDQDSLLISSKGGCLPHRGFHMPQNFDSKYLISALNSSLKRLNKDCLYIYFLHSPLPTHEVIEEIREFCDYALTSGKVLNIGVSVRSPNDLIFFKKNIKLITAFQFNFNLIDQRILSNSILECLTDTSIINIARTPLCFGFLTGKVKIEDCLSEDDHRRNWPVEQLRKWNESVSLFSDIALELNLSTTQLALLYCTSYDFVSSTIPGILETSHAIENSSIINKEPLNKETILLLERIYLENSFYDPSLKQKALNKEIGN
tara:strand:- start:558 stop:1538 length:981 start_codon:yes stop_codon:yes gene_type:complete